MNEVDPEANARFSDYVRGRSAEIADAEAERIDAYRDARSTLIDTLLTEHRPGIASDERAVLAADLVAGRGPKALKTLVKRGSDKLSDDILVPQATAEAEVRDDQIRRLTELVAGPVLQNPDPATLIEPELRRLGYGGDVTPPMLAYLAATTRLLPATTPMLCHTVFVAAPSVGKSYAIKTVFGLLPPIAKKVIDASSPRALIYDDDPIEHVALLIGEADSIATSEEQGPVASAMRNLLTDNQVSYDVVERNPETQKSETRHIRRPGPTVLFTTTTKPLGDQLMSRMFTVDMPDDHAQLQAALQAQAEHELSGSPETNINLVAFQQYLQDRAPWDVVVPFAPWLAAAIGLYANESRLNRDFSRILALIKAVAILRHVHRATGDDARLIATIDDYRLVYKFLHRFYESTVTGLNDDIKAVVGAVSALGSATRVDGPAINKHLPHLQRKKVQRLIKSAIESGWLIDDSTSKTRHQLRLGESLPPATAMPDPEEFGLSPAEVHELRRQKGIAPEPEKSEEELLADLWASKATAA